MILTNYTIKNDDCFIGFYKIEESSDEMLKLIKNKLGDDEMLEFNTFNHERRRCEWLASRILVTMLLGKYTPIHHEVSGKPYIANGMNISISHSYDIVGVMISHHSEIGLDVEKMNLRILKIENKFMESDELRDLKPSSKIQSLYVNWCAKEAMYKAFNIKEFDFKDNFHLDSFNYQSSGSVTGHITQGMFNKDFSIHYCAFEEYMMAWCAEE